MLSAWTWPMRPAPIMPMLRRRSLLSVTTAFMLSCGTSCCTAMHGVGRRFEFEERGVVEWRGLEDLIHDDWVEKGRMKVGVEEDILGLTMNGMLEMDDVFYL